MIKIKCYTPGKPSHNSLIGVVCFFSPIFSYFCLFVAALSPCHGKLPLKKYMKTWPKASRSSRRDCSISDEATGNQKTCPGNVPLPRWVLILMYRAVPLRLFRSRYGMCCFVLGSRYCLAMPKSTTCMTAVPKINESSVIVRQKAHRLLLWCQAGQSKNCLA